MPQLSGADYQGENMSEEFATVNTPTAESAPVSVNSGDGAITFDDLDSIKPVKTAKSETKEVVKETVKEMTKAKEAKDGKDEKSEKSVKEEKKPGEAEEKKDKKAGEKEVKSKVDGDKARPKLKGKYGESEVEIDYDTMFPVKINGVEQMVSFSELQNNYSGKVAYDKKFTELDRQRRAFKAENDKTTGQLKAIMEEQDPDNRIIRMAEYSGRDPVELRKQFLESNINLLEKYYGMTDAEKEADLRSFENRVLKGKLETQNNESKHQQAVKDLDAKIQQIGQTHQITKGEFANRYTELKAAKEAGNLPDHFSITPEFIAETVVKDRLWESAREILDASDSGLQEQQRGEALFDLVEQAYAVGLGQKEVKELAEEMWGKSRVSKAVAEKFDEQEELRTGKKPEAKKSKDTGSKEVLLFEDFM